MYLAIIKKPMKIFNAAVHFFYKHITKRILFLINPEIVHARATAIGKSLGQSPLAKKILALAFSRKNLALSQTIFGISFFSPIGLAAGFDYKAELTQILPALGFGFGSIGPLTNQACQGNFGPMLGRLPRSKSLMVNKGFKNSGVEATLQTLQNKSFAYPVGVSIGKTNTAGIKTQQEAVNDVALGFIKAEASGVPFAYCELNISCPNLMGSIEFYQPTHLEELLAAVQSLNMLRPIFIKMPITKTDQEVIEMMDVIIKYSCIKAVIFGNLQNNRQNPVLQSDEVKKFPVGNFSGLPCQQRSDELIALVFKKYGTHIKIIGCGGVFCTDDAYRKIKLGAHLVQLITGLVYEGPQLVSQINDELALMLSKDGYQNISQAVGIEA